MDSISNSSSFILWNLALKSIRFLVADDNLACEDFLIELAVLQHLKLDTRTMVEEKRLTVNETDCAANQPIGAGNEEDGRLMIRRLNWIPNIDKNRPRVDYCAARTEQDSFPDPALLDPMDYD